MHLAIPPRSTWNLSTLKAITQDWVRAHPSAVFSSTDESIDGYLSETSNWAGPADATDPVLWEGFWEGDLPVLDPPWESEQPETDRMEIHLPVPEISIPGLDLEALVDALADRIYHKVIEKVTGAILPGRNSDPSPDTWEA